MQREGGAQEGEGGHRGGLREGKGVPRGRAPGEDGGSVRDRGLREGAGGRGDSEWD